MVLVWRIPVLTYRKVSCYRDPCSNVGDSFSWKCGCPQAVVHLEPGQFAGSCDDCLDGRREEAGAFSTAPSFCPARCPNIFVGSCTQGLNLQVFVSVLLLQRSVRITAAQNCTVQYSTMKVNMAVQSKMGLFGFSTTKRHEVGVLSTGIVNHVSIDACVWLHALKCARLRLRGTGARVHADYICAA